MEVFLFALGVGIVSYIAFAILFPKAIPSDASDYTKQALERIYQETQGTNDTATILKDQLLEESALVRAVFGWRIMQPIYEAAVQAGYLHQLRFLVTLMLAGFGISLVLFIGLGITLPAALLLASLLGYYLPYRHCVRAVRKRNRQFLDQFPDALDMIVRSVRSGFPLTTALQMLADNSQSPVKEEFRQVVDELGMGRNLNQALARLAVRINEPDIRFFVVVLTVQQETGGNLAEIINNLSSIIRKRKQLRHKIRAMTSEGRATAWVLGLLPVFVFCALYAMQPTYLMPFFTDPIGMMMFGTALGLLGICVFVVKQMIDVEI
ncbi:MAG: type II secretion system F family protein [Alphaproteobacteria bacterium]|nr:type II secretion system F family protein [Alphaproteobacteria bacterium]